MKIAENPEGDKILYRENGKPKNCPFQPSVLIPGKLAGQIGESHKPCGDWCPFFQLLEEVEGNQTLKIACTGSIINLHISEVITNKSNLQTL